MFGDHPNVEPAFTFDELCSTDVVDVLAALLAVVYAFVIEADLRLVVPHVDECFIFAVAEPDLRARASEPAIDQDESQPRLLW